MAHGALARLSAACTQQERDATVRSILTSFVSGDGIEDGFATITRVMTAHLPPPRADEGSGDDDATDGGPTGEVEADGDRVARPKPTTTPPPTTTTTMTTRPTDGGADGHARLQVQRSGCMLIRRLCQTETRRRMAVDAGVLVAILQAMRAYFDDPYVQRAGCRCLVALVKRDSETVERGAAAWEDAAGDEWRCMYAVEEGALEVLGTLLGSLPTHANLLKHAVLAILALTFGSVYRAHLAVEAGVLHALGTAASHVHRDGKRDAIGEDIDLAISWLTMQAKVQRSPLVLHAQRPLPPQIKQTAIAPAAPTPPNAGGWLGDLGTACKLCLCLPPYFGR